MNEVRNKPEYSNIDVGQSCCLYLVINLKYVVINLLNDFKAFIK